MSTETRIPLSRLSPELIDRYGKLPGYRKLAIMAMDGQLRTEMVNGRHYVFEADLPAIAETLGLTPKTDTPAHAPCAAVEHAAA